MKTRNIFWLSAALLMAACTKEENSPMNPSSMAIQFDAGIMATSRVNNGVWEANDKIGVSMRINNATATTENIPYVTASTNGSFTAESTALQFPEAESPVTFYAYYPYSADKLSGDNLTFTVDGKTDVLYATPKEVAADAQTSNKVELSFNHALSQVKLETTGFPEDIEVTISEASNEATMNITTGVVTASGSTPTTVPFVATTTNTYLAIALPCEGESKTLVIKSMSEAKQWTYTFDATFKTGYQYAYKATVTPNGINFSTNETTPITVWENIDTTPENLQNPEESDIELTIAQYLAGKTFVPNITYFYDSPSGDGIGWLNNPDTYFGEHIGSPGPWDQYLYNGCKIASISFYYDEENEKLMANSIDGIEVTIDEMNRTLTFSKEPFSYNWIFTDLMNSEVSDVNYWQLIAHTEGSSYDVNFTSTAIKDFFKNNELHLTYWSNKDKCYYIVNFIQKEQDAATEQ